MVDQAWLLLPMLAKMIISNGSSIKRVIMMLHSKGLGTPDTVQYCLSCMSGCACACSHQAGLCRNQSFPAEVRCVQELMAAQPLHLRPCMPSSASVCVLQMAHSSTHRSDHAASVATLLIFGFKCLNARAFCHRASSCRAEGMYSTWLYFGSLLLHLQSAPLVWALITHAC